MSNDVFYGGFRESCVQKLQKGTTVLATDADDPHHILGWSCGDVRSHTVHYVYVKHAYRRGGLGTTLVGALFPTAVGLKVSTLGRHHRDWARKYNLSYDPYSWMKQTP